MLRATLKNLAARKLRLAMSAIAIILGVAFVAGSYIFTDTLNQGFVDIFSKVTPDVTVRPEGFGQNFESFSTDARTVPAGLVDTVADVAGVRQAEGDVSNSTTFVLDKDDKVVGGSGAPGIGANWYDAPNAEGESVVSIVDGRPPARSGEGVLDEKTG